MSHPHRPHQPHQIHLPTVCANPSNHLLRLCPGVERRHRLASPFPLRRGSVAHRHARCLNDGPELLWQDGLLALVVIVLARLARQLMRHVRGAGEGLFLCIVVREGRRGVRVGFVARFGVCAVASQHIGDAAGLAEALGEERAEGGDAADYDDEALLRAE